MSTLVGRQPELAVVEAFLADDGSDVALVIAGEAGIGKTAIWDEAVRRARDKGICVLACRPAETEAKLSFAGLADLLAPVERDVFDVLPVPQRRALDIALLRADPDGQAAERRVVGTALLSTLRELASASRVVVAVDDAQWLDAPTTAALRFALRRIDMERISAVLSVRERGSGGELTADLPVSLVHRLPVGPMSLASLHRVIVERLGFALPRPTLVRVVRVSGGNPFYALEIARLIRDDPLRSTAALPVPEDLLALVAERIAKLPVTTRSALLRTAALARPDLALVDASALVAAEEAGLVLVDGGSRIEFAHPLFASAVYASAPLSSRRETHAALANEVSDREESARHLALACDGPDDRVAGIVEDAARDARTRGAPDAAAELSALAVRLTPADTAAVERRRFELAEHLRLAGDFEQAARLLEQLCTTLPPGDDLARALLALANIDFWRAGESAAVALAEQAVQVAEDPLLRARCEALTAVWVGTIDVPRAAAAARSALATLESRPGADPGLLALTLCARVRADLFLGRGLDLNAAERALALEQVAPPTTVDGRVGFKLGQWLRYVDDLTGASRQLLAAEESARTEGDEASLANILINRVLVECWAGDWEEAQHLVHRLGDALEQKGVVSESGEVWLAYVAAHLGRLEVVRAAAGRAQPQEPIVAMLWQRSLGLAELAVGESAAADLHLSQALAALDAMDFREPAVWRVDGDAIEASVAVGHIERAERLVERFEQRAAGSRIPWSLAVAARSRALILAAQGDQEGAADAVARAVDEHSRSPVPFELARTLLLQGQILRRLKRRRQAREALETAFAIFERLGAEPWADRSRAELRRVAVRKAPLELSATELRIAELAAAGLKNDDIATSVFLTRKTVEANLGRAYRKLGIRSRAQLAVALDESRRELNS